MAPRKRRDLLPRRRRHDDEGEEDDSVVGDQEQYASSQGSIPSGAEDEGNLSEGSIDDELELTSTKSPVVAKHTIRESANKPSDVHNQKFQTTADTEAMLRGLHVSKGEDIEEVMFDETEAAAAARDSILPHGPIQRSKSTPAQQGRPRVGAQPPTHPRKGYFFHDDRSASHNSVPSAGPRGRGRGLGGPSHRGNAAQSTNIPPRQWVHDLHESVNEPPTNNAPAPVQQPPHPPVQSTAVKSTPPNRSFSTTTVLGNVPVNISLPDSDVKTSATMVKKHYTLLPQHRPPLRRDKPVRISIPDEHPRYIFPSTDRSFIFIPRALRPNQQQMRGRGRGSFHGSRRTSMYGGSVYTPSVGMSRRPSLAASNPGSGIHTPTGAPMMPFPPGMQKPIVRMPLPPVQSYHSAMHNTEVFLGDNSAIIHSPPTTLPMHQPTPQKTVSVEHIESPTLNTPQQQPQLPFHQQIPQEMSNTQAQQKMPHIPEGAIYAQPFQPYPNVQQTAFYNVAYPPHMLSQHTSMGYNPALALGGPVMTQHSVDGQQASTTGPIAHETNGMVYYYDPAQQYMHPQMMMGGMNVMSSPYYYPPPQNQTFYQ